MTVARTADPILTLMSAGELAQAVGERLRLACAGKSWTMERTANVAGVPVEVVQELEAGQGSLQGFMAVAAAYGIAHEIWNATRPQARSLDELERIEIAIADRAPG